MFKFKLKNGITGTATPVGTMHKVVFSNGVETKVDNTLVEKYLSNGTWQKKQQSPRETVFILRTKIDHRLHDGQVKNKLLKDSP